MRRPVGRIGWRCQCGLAGRSTDDLVSPGQAADEEAFAPPSIGPCRRSPQVARRAQLVRDVDNREPRPDAAPRSRCSRRPRRCRPRRPQRLANRQTSPATAAVNPELGGAGTFIGSAPAAPTRACAGASTMAARSEEEGRSPRRSRPSAGSSGRDPPWRGWVSHSKQRRRLPSIADRNG